MFFNVSCANVIHKNTVFFLLRYQGLDNLPASLTLGRRGQYSGGAGHHRMYGASASARAGTRAGAGAGAGASQYATLNKQCRTLESSDFY